MRVQSDDVFLCSHNFALKGSVHWLLGFRVEEDCGEVCVAIVPFLLLWAAVQMAQEEGDVWEGRASRPGRSGGFMEGPSVGKTLSEKA